jgi:hypothetical protein
MGLRRIHLFWIQVFICQALCVILCPPVDSLECMVCGQILRELHSLTYSSSFVALRGLRQRRLTSYVLSRDVA